MFTSQELQIIRASLDVITIKGSDAKILSQLQIKIEEFLSPPNKEDQEKKSK
jgi:hypothetical protein